jgi:hypothetical protein
MDSVPVTAYAGYATQKYSIYEFEAAVFRTTVTPPPIPPVCPRLRRMHYFCGVEDPSTNTVITLD